MKTQQYALIACLIALCVAIPSIATTQSYSFVLTSAPLDKFQFANGPNEVSVGYHKPSDTILLQILTETAAINWNYSTTPPTPTWRNVATTVDHLGIGFDPIGYSDPTTNRYFNIQLILPCSTSFITDDAGTTWIPTQLPCSAPGFDHETIGTSVYHQPLPQGIIYPNAVYYCAQQGVAILGNGLSYCARSDTGGLAWGPAIPMNLLTCFPLHGHIQGNPNDGTIFVPHKRCADEHGNLRLGALKSEDNGLTWSKITVPGTNASLSDPQIRFSSDGTLWFAGVSRNLNGDGGQLIVATSNDNGNTWTNPVDVSSRIGNNNTEFPMLAVGTNGRAAVAWYGTMESNDDQSSGFFGKWYIYASFTYDGGTTWTTTQVTSSPVQYGRICLGGVNCNGGRNLLDFQDATIDKYGHFVIAYADGCSVDSCQDPNTSKAGVPTIALQTGGQLLK